MRNITDTAFSITAAYGDGQEEPDSAKTAPETIPVMRHIHWSNISVMNAKRLGDISSLKQSPLEDFSLRNVQAIGTQAGIRCNNSRGLVFENISIQDCSKPTFHAQQVNGLEIRGLAVPAGEDSAPVVLLEQVSGAFITDCAVRGGKGVFLKIGQGTSDIATSGNRLGLDIKERE